MERMTKKAVLTGIQKALELAKNDEAVKNLIEKMIKTETYKEQKSYIKAWGINPWTKKWNSEYKMEENLIDGISKIFFVGFKEIAERNAEKKAEVQRILETREKTVIFLKIIDGQKYIQMIIGKDVKKIKETEKAICLVQKTEKWIHSTISIKENNYVWLPKSQIIEEKNNNLIYVKQWLFNKKF